MLDNRVASSMDTHYKPQILWERRWIKKRKKKKIFLPHHCHLSSKKSLFSLPKWRLTVPQNSNSKTKISWIFAVSVYFVWNNIQTLRSLEQELLRFAVFHHEMPQKNGLNIWTVSLHEPLAWLWFTLNIQKKWEEVHWLCSGCCVYFCLSTCLEILLTASTLFLRGGVAFPVFFY